MAVSAMLHHFMKRRSFLSAAAAALAATRLDAQSIAKAAADPAYKIKNQGIKHTLMGWCWKPMDTLELAKHAKEIDNSRTTVRFTVRNAAKNTNGKRKQPMPTRKTKPASISIRVKCLK